MSATFGGSVWDTYAPLLGADRTHPALESLLTVTEGWNESEAYSDPADHGAVWVVMEHAEQRLRVQFRENIFMKVSLFPGDRTEHLLHVEGVDLLRDGHARVKETLGAPIRAGRTSLEYQVGQYLVTFGFLNGKVRAVTFRPAR